MRDSQPYVRPGFVLNRLVNPITRHLGSVTVLAVRGRASGELRTVPMGKPFVFEGARYLVSGRGSTHWARNLRAAGKGELRVHGRTEAFRAVEIVGPRQERIISAYRAALGRSVDPYFAEIPNPADHPVFQIEPLDAEEGA
jgi:hypothetical protein